MINLLVISAFFVNFRGSSVQSENAKKVLDLYNRLTSEEQRSILELIGTRKPSHPENREVVEAAYQGFTKKSSAACSTNQRKVFLGLGGSGLLSLRSDLVLGDTVVNLAAFHTSGELVVLTHSDHNQCRVRREVGESELDQMTQIIKTADGAELRALPPNPLKGMMSDISSRFHPCYSRIPLSDTGELLLSPPNYPVTEIPNLWLQASEWAPILKTLGLDWKTKYWMTSTDQIQLNYKNRHMIAMIKLEGFIYDRN